MATVLALIAALTALCAVALGPLVSLWAARQQARVAVLSSNRQTWINTLRDAIAEFVAIATFLSLATDNAQLHNRSERMFYYDAKVRLLLNPKEKDHQDLMAAMFEVRIAAGDTLGSKPTGNPDDLRAAISNVVVLSQSVLKREWERVKKVE